MSTFLDELPREIRDCIYWFLLVKNTGSSAAVDITNKTSLYYMPHQYCSTEGLHGATHPSEWCFSSLKLANIGSTTNLRTCKRFAIEGAEILYGSSKISCKPDHAFASTFLLTICPFNGSCIRSVHLSMDRFFKYDTTSFTRPQLEEILHDNTNFFVNLFSQTLNQLQELVLAIPVGRRYHLNLNSGLPSSKTWWIRAHCSMLWFSAWTTIRHPILKRAVWSQRWITRYTPDAAEGLQYLDISVRITAPRTTWGIRNGDKFTEVAWFGRPNLLAEDLPLQSFQVKKSVPFLRGTNCACLTLR